MSFEGLWNFLVIAVVLGFAAWSYLDNRKRKRLFQECAERLGLQDFKQTSSTISGKLRGLPLDVKLHAGSKNTPAHTTIDVTFDPCPILLHLRLQTSAEERSVERGEAIDLATCDPVFDKTWIVEAAPPERVIRLLSSPSLRAQLMAFSHIDGASVKIEDGKLSLYRRGTEVGATAVATERMELAVALAEAVIADAGAPLDPGEIDVAGSGYRTARRADPDAVAEAKVRELKVLRATRVLSGLRVAAIVSHLFPAAMLLAMQLSSTAHALGALPILLFQGFATFGIVRSYREQLRSAPSARLLPWTREGMIAGWAISLILLFRTMLMG